MENKLEQIQEISKQWRRTNIGSTEAMQMVDNIISQKSLIGHSLQIIDIESNTIVFSTIQNKYYKVIFCKKS